MNNTIVIEIYKALNQGVITAVEAKKYAEQYGIIL